LILRQAPNNLPFTRFARSLQGDAMGKITLAFLLLASLIRLEADEMLKNGDFSEGLNQWNGDGGDVAQIAPDLAPRGLIINLSAQDWTKAVQEFRPIGTDFSCTIIYKLTADTQFSTDQKDYQNVPGHIGYTLWKPFRIPQGDWMMMLCDFGNSVTGAYYPIKPKMGADGTATFQANLIGLSSREAKTLTLAFPPGQGSVIILSASMVNASQPILANTRDFTLTGDGVTIQNLNNGEKAFSNRGYVWQGIPASLTGQNYTQTPGGEHPHLTVHAKNDFTLQVITGADLNDFDKTDIRFSYTDKNNTEVFLYQKKISAGQDFVIPQDSWTSVLILLPTE
jgi:hypothetical protein